MQNDPDLPVSEFFVAVSGSDHNPGTREKLLATLERARDAVRALRATDGDRSPCLARRAIPKVKESVPDSLPFLERKAVDLSEVSVAGDQGNVALDSAGCDPDIILWDGPTL